VIFAAGILVQARDGQVLFLRRSGGTEEGLWAFPGGHIEPGETPLQAALRETVEEIGIDFSQAKPRQWVRRQKDGVDFTTFIVQVPRIFSPNCLNEHDKFTWALPDDAPTPLHPGAKVALARLKMDELGVARAIAMGELSSPQRYENMSLFAMRITGTGVAYRQGIDEYVWRDPKIYLNTEFLARCNGLPVIVDHPKKNALDSQEFQDRVVGTILLPYIDGQEVWGVAKIFDDSTIQMLETHQLSTSPAVVFRSPGSTKTKRLEDGKTLLIEGKPSLLDHLAICEQGVWDKGGEPAGVKSTINNGDSNQMSGSIAPAGGPNAGNPPPAVPDADPMDKVMAACDAIMKRMDALETSMGGAAPAPEGAAPGGDPNTPGPMMDGGDNEYPEEIRTMPEATAADKVRKDSAKATWRKDGGRKDGELTIKHEGDEQAFADSVAKRVESAVAKRLAALEAKIPAQLTDAEVSAMGEIQARADTIYAAFGDSAPRPLQGETGLAYRKRLAKGLQTHSMAWKDVDLSALPENVVSVAEGAIYADAMTAARNPANVEVDQLRAVKTRDATGRVVTSFVGEPRAWMSDFTANRRRLAGIRNGSN